MNPLEIAGLDHVVLRIRDRQRSLAFYCGVLGLTVERELDIGLIQLRAGASLIDLVVVDSALGRSGGPAPGAEGRNMDHFALQLARFDAAAILAHLDAHSVEHGGVAARYGALGTGPSIYAQDPDGNTVELKGPATDPPATRV